MLRRRLEWGIEMTWGGWVGPFEASSRLQCASISSNSMRRTSIVECRRRDGDGCLLAAMIWTAAKVPKSVPKRQTLGS